MNVNCAIYAARNVRPFLRSKQAIISKLYFVSVFKEGMIAKKCLTDVSDTLCPRAMKQENDVHCAMRELAIDSCIMVKLAADVH